MYQSSVVIFVLERLLLQRSGRKGPETEKETGDGQRGQNERPLVWTEEVQGVCVV